MLVLFQRVVLVPLKLWIALHELVLCVFVFIKKVAVYSQIDFSVTKIQKKKLIKALKKKLVCLMLNKYILGLNIH